MYKVNIKSSVIPLTQSSCLPLFSAHHSISFIKFPSPKFFSRQSSLSHNLPLSLVHFFRPSLTFLFFLITHSFFLVSHIYLTICPLVGPFLPPTTHVPSVPITHFFNLASRSLSFAIISLFALTILFNFHQIFLTVASEPRGQRTPHFLEHGVQRSQGHRISDNWIGGSFSILAEIALENIIFGRHCRNNWIIIKNMRI